MFSRILRTLDLMFVFTARARHAHMDARIHGLPVGVLYDADTRVKADDFVPHLHRGAPTPDLGERFLVGRLDPVHGHVSLAVTRKEYVPATDSWRNREDDLYQKRSPEDVWLTEEEFETIYYQAASKERESP